MLASIGILNTMSWREAENYSAETVRRDITKYTSRKWRAKAKKGKAAPAGSNGSTQKHTGARKAPTSRENVSSNYDSDSGDANNASSGETEETGDENNKQSKIDVDTACADENSVLNLISLVLAYLTLTI